MLPSMSKKSVSGPSETVNSDPKWAVTVKGRQANDF